MTIYRVCKRTAETSRNNQAEAYKELCTADPGNEQLFTSLDEAKAAYDKIKIEERATEYRYNRTYYVWEMKELDEYLDCDEPEDYIETLKDAFWTNTGGLHLASEISDEYKPEE